MSDYGFGGPGLLVSMDLAQRILETPGNVTPRGLFDMPVLPPPTGKQSDVSALRKMLRNLVMNVRQPSTQAAPFRSTNFYFRHGAAFDGISPFTISATVTFGGNVTVPIGTNVVITDVNLTCSRTVGTGTGDPYALSQLGVDPARLALLVNGVALPGFENGGRMTAGFWAQSFFPVSAADNRFSGYVRSNIMPLGAPIPLRAGDVVTARATSSGVASDSQIVAQIEVAGYMYPIEVDEDGVRGTLADRSGSE